VDQATVETGLANLVDLRDDKNPPFEMATAGLTGINPLKAIQ